MTKRIISEENISLGNLPLIGSRILSYEINHEGKINHVVYIDFKSLDNLHTAKLYHLNYEQFEEYVLQANSTNGYIEPKKYGQKIEKNGEMKISINKSKRVFFYFMQERRIQSSCKNILKRRVG